MEIRNLTGKEIYHKEIMGVFLVKKDFKNGELLLENNLIVTDNDYTIISK